MAEKEYIEREALIKVCKKIIHDRWNETTAPVSWSHAYADFIDDINNQPAADVQPVIRCKDCKHYSSNKPKSQLHRSGYCLLNEDVTDDRRIETDFCSFGERKELDNDT